jgi:hypothetical protein
VDNLLLLYELKSLTNGVLKAAMCYLSITVNGGTNPRKHGGGYLTFPDAVHVANGG